MKTNIIHQIGNKPNNFLSCVIVLSNEKFYIFKVLNIITESEVGWLVGWWVSDRWVGGRCI